MDKENSAFTCLGLVLFAVLSVVVGSIMNGWAISVLWRWFIVGVFGLPLLSIPQAIGFALVIRVLTHQSKPKEPEKSTIELVVEIIATGILSPLMVVGLGYIVSLFL